MLQGARAEVDEAERRGSGSEARRRFFRRCSFLSSIRLGQHLSFQQPVSHSSRDLSGSLDGRRAPCRVQCPSNSLLEMEIEIFFNLLPVRPVKLTATAFHSL